MAEADDAALQAVIARHCSDTILMCSCNVEDLRDGIDAESVDVTVTFPPTEETWIPKFRELGDFAAHVLAPDGLMAVMIHPEFLPEILRALNGAGLRWITEFDYRCPGRSRRIPYPHQGRHTRQPTLIFGRGNAKLTPVRRLHRGTAFARVRGPQGQPVVGRRTPFAGAASERARTRGLRPCNPWASRHGAGRQKTGVHLCRCRARPKVARPVLGQFGQASDWRGLGAHNA